MAENQFARIRIQCNHPAGHNARVFLDDLEISKYLTDVGLQISVTDVVKVTFTVIADNVDIDTMAALEPHLIPPQYGPDNLAEVTAFGDDSHKYKLKPKFETRKCAVCWKLSDKDAPTCQQCGAEWGKL